MESRTEEDKQIFQDIYELGLKGRERYLEMLGIDIGQLNELEKEINNEYAELATKLQDIRRKKVNERAKIQEKDLEKSKYLLSQEAEKALNADLSSQIAGIEHLHTSHRAIIDKNIMFKPHCHYTTCLSKSLLHEDSISLNPPTGDGCTGSVKYKGSENIAQPFVDIKGKAGTITAATVNTGFKFAFTPSTEGYYCIRPLVLINGWWLLWTWGGCTPADPTGKGNMYVKIKVHVDQLSQEIDKIEHVVQKENNNSKDNTEGALYYYSGIFGSVGMTVYLKKDHEAVISVECEAFAQVNNGGRAIIDMQSGEGFYFMVDSVWVGNFHTIFANFPSVTIK